MANRFNETDSFINTVLTEANWTQANIKIKLNEENDGNNPNPFADDDDEKKKNKKKDDENNPNAPRKDDENDPNDPNAPKPEDMKDSVEYGYDACPLCEATLENDDIIFENIDSHFNSLLNVVDKVSSLQEGEDLDEGDLVVESNAPEGHCPLCESVIEDDEVLLANMNEHFDIVLEMLDEMNGEYGPATATVMNQKPPSRGGRASTQQELEAARREQVAKARGQAAAEAQNRARNAKPKA